VRPPPNAKAYGKVGVWSTQKLAVLRCYLGQNDGFLKATTSAGQRHYIDLFAGPGQNRVRRTGAVVDGSPLIALHAGPPSFTGLHWSERKPSNSASLEAHRLEHLDRNIHLYPGDGNERIDEILRSVPRRYPVFAFLDPYGAELHWQTLVKLAQHRPAGGRKIELFILFASPALTRLMPRDPAKMIHQAILDRMMPSATGWRRVYEQRTRGSASASEIREALLEEYVQGLRALGYRHVPPPLLIRRPTGHPLYFLIFASDHPVGEKIMRWCLNHATGVEQQLSYLPYTER